MNSADPATPAEATDRAQLLVAELNQLRVSAGMPSYRQLAARTHYSRSALWRATHSPYLPSREITLALASACGGDRAEWDRKWHTARVQAATGRAATSDPGQASPPAAATPPARALPGRRRLPGRLAVLLAAATVATVAAGAAMVIAGPRPTAAPRSALPVSIPYIRPADGDDPYIRHCGGDQQRLQYQDLYWPDHQRYGWLELYHSHLCDASWGYVFGPNSARWQVTIIARRLPGNTVAPSSFSGNAKPNSWGNVLITTRGSCVRIEAYVTVRSVRGPTAVTECLPDGQRPGIGPPPTPAPPPPSSYAN